VLCTTERAIVVWRERRTLLVEQLHSVVVPDLCRRCWLRRCGDEIPGVLLLRRQRGHSVVPDVIISGTVVVLRQGRALFVMKSSSD